MPGITVPDVVRARAAVDGDGGRRWVDALPGVLDDLEQEWSVRIGEQLPGGTTAFVARARTASSAPAVVKVAVPDSAFTRTVRTLQRAGGRGYVHLLAHEPAHQAMLLEGLGPALSALDLSPEVRLHTLAAVLGQVWAVPAGPDAGEPVDKASSLYEFVTRLWQELDRPCPRRVIARALECAEQRAAAFDASRTVVVHGDAAAANLLQVPAPRRGAEAGYVFVDPDPFVGDPAYDLGVALRDWCPELLAGDAPALAREYCHLLATASGTDETAVWEWGYLERVSTGLYALSLGASHLARPLLLTAEALCDGGPERRTR